MANHFQAPAMPHIDTGGYFDMKGPKPGPHHPQLDNKWGIGPPEPHEQVTVVASNDEVETEFELDGGSEASPGDGKDSNESEVDSDSSGFEDEDGENGNDVNRVAPEDSPVSPPSQPAPTPTQQPTGFMQPMKSRMQPESGSPSTGLSPEVLAEIMSLVHREVVPSVVEKLQRSPSDTGLEGYEIPIGVGSVRYASSIASSSAQTEPLPASHSRPSPSSKGFTAPTNTVNVPAPPPPSNSSSFTSASSSRTSPTPAPSQPGVNRPIYQSNSSVVVQPGSSSFRNGMPSPTVQRPTVRFSDRAPPLSAVRPDTVNDDAWRSKVPKTVEDFSPLDSKWGVLFESSGTPTPRLEMVFRGLARYLIEELEPKQSIVVTPQKMGSLYRMHPVETQSVAYSALFRSTTPAANAALSELYLAIGAEYHLVPALPQDPPTVPGLTPAGFATWFITNVLAYPDEEALRLNHIFEVWPVNADGPLDLGKAERLPKMLGRHLLPQEPLLAQRGMFENGLQKFRDVLRQSSRAERVTGAVLLAEKRNLTLGAFGGAVGGYMNGASSRTGRYSDDEQGRRLAPNFSEVNYQLEGKESGERKHSSSPNDNLDSAMLRINSMTSPRAPNPSTSTVVYGSPTVVEKCDRSLERRSSTRRRSPPQRRGSYRASEPDISYGTSPTVDTFPSSISAVYTPGSDAGMEKKYHGRSRNDRGSRDKEWDKEKTRERNRERERDYGRDRTRDRDRDRDREREREREHERPRDRERQRDREKDRDSDRDSEYRLSSSGRKKHSVDAIPRSDMEPRRRSEVLMGSDKAKDDRGPTWNDLTAFGRGLLRAATLETLASNKRDRHRNSN